MSIQFLHGDCLELMKTLPDKSVDCFICDLPYGCLHAGRKQTGEWYDRRQNGGNSCKWDIKLNLELFWEQVKRLAKNDHTPVIHFCNTKFGAELISSNPDWFRYDLVWNKENGVSFLSANKMPLRSHEMIYIFAKKGAFYNRIDIEGEFSCSPTSGVVEGNVYDCADRKKPIVRNGARPDKRCVKSVLTFKPTKGKNRHPTEKPIELYKWLLSRYCPEGGTILDPTAGSFNSCIAGKELGLTSIGIEKDEGFYNKAVSLLKDS